MTMRRTGLLLVLVVVVGLTVVLVRDRVLAACTVTVGARSVDLDQSQAEAAATAVAAVVRRSGTAKDARSAVSKSIDLGPADIRAVASALSGRTQAALTCRNGGADEAEPDRLDAVGLTERGRLVREDILARFGELALGGFAPGGVSSGHMAGSAHYEGRAIDAFFRPVNDANQETGWALAQYLVAHAQRLEIATVIYDGKIWTARRAAQGWREYRVDTSGRSDAVAAVLEHRDHVHVDVAD